MHTAFSVTLIIILFFSGCASHSTHAKVYPSWGRWDDMPSKMGWWRVAIRMGMPEDYNVRWHMDLLLAHRLFGPVLRKHSTQFMLWRFHRRAANDVAGHQFSFIFYCTADTAEAIMAEMKQNALLTELKQAGKIESTQLQATDHIAKPDIEDTSDTHWSLKMQQAWPYYIMGISQMWLTLIDLDYDEKYGDDNPSIEKMEEIYNTINEAVTKTWQEEGRHALLHHLNALFGYQPVPIMLSF